jgi:hypothetical protein
LVELILRAIGYAFLAAFEAVLLSAFPSRGQTFSAFWNSKSLVGKICLFPIWLFWLVFSLGAIATLAEIFAGWTGITNVRGS